MPFIILIPIIFLASFILTMVGLGGGLIFSPLFVLLDFPVTEAVSASLFLNGAAAVSASINYLSKKMVDIKIALPLMICSVLSAPLGALLTSRMNIRSFTAVLALIILGASVRMLFSGKKETIGGEVTAFRRIIGGGCIGIVVGILAGLLGIGGGVFIVPLLIYTLKVSTKTAAATSMFMVVFSSFSGFVAHMSRGDMDWGFILPAAVASIVAGQIGSRIMVEKLRGETIRRIFGVVLLLFALKLIHRAFL